MIKLREFMFLELKQQALNPQVWHVRKFNFNCTMLCSTVLVRVVVTCDAQHLQADQRLQRRRADGVQVILAQV